MKTITKICLLAIIIFACKSQHGTSKSNSNSLFSIDIQEKYSIREPIKIAVTNTSTVSFSIIDPELIHIERLNNGVWEKVKILTAPCGSPGNAPMEKILVKPNDSHYFQWDQKERWCEYKQGKENKTSLPKTIEEQVPNGKYRITIIYQLKNSPIFDKLYKEFLIIDPIK